MFEISRLAVALAVVCVAGTNLSSSNFWFDEAGQYWLAVGQYHYTPLETPDGSLRDIWRHVTSNSDPGGYTLLIRAVISVFGSQPAYLRMCSFAFAVLAVVLIYRIAREAGVKPMSSLALATVPFIPTQVLETAFETRAYVFEACGVVALFLATYLVVQRPSTWRSALWLGVVIVFSTSRYSFLVFVAGSLGALLFASIYFRSMRPQIPVALGILFLA